MQPSYDWILSTENLKESVKTSTANQTETDSKENRVYADATQMSNPEVPVPIPPEVVSINAAQRLNGGHSGELNIPPNCPNTVNTQVHAQSAATVPCDPAPLPKETPSAEPHEISPPVAIPEVKKEAVKPIHFITSSSEEAEDENRFVDPTTGEKWIRCQNPFCGKWRFVPPEVSMPSANPWFCIMNSWDEDIASCDYPQLQTGYIVTKKEEEPEKSWMPRREVHFEPITSNPYL